MISGESSTQPSSPPPDSHLVTAQLEGSTLTRAEYNTIHTLTSSLLCIPTGDLVYDGHTLNPLTLHWHCVIGRWLISLSLYTAMAQEGIRKFIVNGEEIIIPHFNVSETFVCIVCHHWCPYIHRRLVFSMLLMMGI